MNAHTPAEVRRYDLFKLIVTLVLGAIIVILLLRGGCARPAQPPPAPTEAATATAAPAAAASATPKPIAAPTIDMPVIPDAQGRLRLSGSGAPGSMLQVVADGEVLGQVTVGQDGDWALEVDLSPGDYRLQARALDDEGAVVAESETVAFSQPEPALTAPAMLTPTEETALTAGVVELGGTGAPGAEIEVLLDGEVLGSATVGADGAWTLEQELPAGEHSLTVRNLDDPDSLSQPVAVRVEAAAEPAGGAGDERVCGVGEDRGDTYVVARCEYMALIASRTGVRVVDLIAANPQVADPDLIYPGQVLNLPPRE